VLCVSVAEKNLLIQLQTGSCSAKSLRVVFDVRQMRSDFDILLLYPEDAGLQQFIFNDRSGYALCADDKQTDQRVICLKTVFSFRIGCSHI